MNKSFDFMTPRLVGKRFEGHAIPFEVLKDLAVLENLIIDAAKWKYREDHSERQRLPRGFTEGVSLQLTEVRNGSAIPVIMLTLLTSTSLLPEVGSNLTYFEQGRDAIFEAVSSAEKDDHKATILPPSLLGYFDQLGRSLRDDEALELNPADTLRPARLTKEIRRRLLLQSDTIQELTEEVSLRGTVPEMDQEKMTFQFQLVSGPRIKAMLDARHVDLILEAFNGYRSNKRVLIRGVGRFDRSEKLLGLQAVDHVAILDDMDVGVRLEEFKTLKNGWLDGKGFAPDHQQLAWLAAAFQHNYPDELQLPYLYPTAEGGVQAEWSLGNWEISLEIELGTHRAQWQALDLTTDVTDERMLDLNKDSDWQWLAQAIAPKQGGQA